MKPTAANNNRPLRVFLTFLKALLLCITYAVIWAVLWESSQAFWFLPAGLRFTILLYTRPANWPIWIAGEWLAILYLHDVHTNYANILEHGIGNLAPSMVYVAAVVWFLKKADWRYSGVKMQSELISISAVIFFAAIGAAVLLFLLMPGDSPFLAFERFSIQGIATYSLGDVAGVLFIWSLVELIMSTNAESKLNRTLLIRDFLLVFLPILAGVIFFTLLAPELDWAILAMLFVPIVYLSTKHGWIGSTLSVVTLNVVAGFIYLLKGNATALFNTQLFLASVGTTGLFLGAAMSQQTELIRHIRKISQRVIETQENERSRISKDLHDHVGQLLTALRSRLFILRKSELSDVSLELDMLDKLAADAYQDIHDIVDEISPNELLRFGLQRSLENTSFHNMLRAANIRYHTSFKGHIPDIPEQIQLSIYRVAQEALSNATKYSQATDCFLYLGVTDDSKKSLVDFRVQDNGIGFKVGGCDKGHGTQNIHDRVQALGGTMTLESGKLGTSITVAIPL